MMRLSPFKKASLLLLTLNLLCFLPSCDGATVLSISPMGTVDSGQISVAADNNNNAVTVFTNNSLIESRYSPGNQLWEPSLVISDAIGAKESPDVAMDATSTALAVWNGSDLISTETIEANILTAGSFGTPEILEGPTTNSLSAPSVAMNGSGGGVAGWSSGFDIHASFFTAGAWVPFTVVATSYGVVKTAYSTIGNAGIAWAQFDLGLNNIFGTTSIGFTWQTPSLLDITGSIAPEIGMDSSGNAIAVWGGNFANFDIKWSRFDGFTWSAAQVLSLASGNINPKIAVAPNGTAIAVWIDAANFIQLSQFNGTSWSVPVPIASGTVASITMDSLGNALIGWVSPTNQLFNARLPLGGVLDTPVLITTGADPILNLPGTLDLSLSSTSNIGVTAWSELNIESASLSYATFILFPALAPTPPIGITGRVCSNSFAMQSDRVHIISWDPSTDPTTVSYYIYRNGVLISIVPASGPFTFYDHNRTKGSPDTYTVYAVNSEGTLSTPVSITLD